MALPKRRHSNTRGKKRRGASPLTVEPPAYCRECGAPIQPHCACKECGALYGKRQVIKPKKKKEKAAPETA